jgi:hypothetical protein
MCLYRMSSSTRPVPCNPVLLGRVEMHTDCIVAIALASTNIKDMTNFLVTQLGLR